MHIFEKIGVKDRFELAVHGRRLLGTEHAGAISRAEQSKQREDHSLPARPKVA